MSSAINEDFYGEDYTYILGIILSSLVSPSDDYSSEYDYLLGRMAGHTISIIGLGMAVSGALSIISAVSGGAAITVGSCGAIIGGASISVTGVACGTAVAGYGAAVASYASRSFEDDLRNFDQIKYKSGLNEGRPAGGNPREDNLIRKDRASVKSDDMRDFLRANEEDPDRWEYVMETWETPDGISYERHYWTNGYKSYYHD